MSPIWCIAAPELNAPLVPALSATCTSKLQGDAPAVHPSNCGVPAVTAPFTSVPSMCSAADAMPLTSVSVPLTWTVSV